MMVKKFKNMDGINEMLKGLLENKVVDGIIAPQFKDGRYFQNILVFPEQIENVEPFIPVFNINTGTFLSKWVGTEKKVAVILKPCELRAVIELVKLKQIDREKVLLITTDCYGTFTLATYSANTKKLGIAPSGEDVKKHKNLGMRSACTYCAHHVPTEADIVLGRIGKEFFIGGTSDKGLEALKDMGLKEEALKKWEEAASALDEAGKKERMKAYDKIRDLLKDPKKLEEFFANCIGCMNCRDVCPVCYCKECFFDKPLTNPSADEMLMLANHKNGLGVPLDVLFFQMVRLNHMAISCVGCGMCDDACPKDIPISLVFESIGEDVQGAFDYIAGRSVKEPIPLTIFKEDDKEPYAG